MATKWERRDLISVIALVVAVGSPFVTFFLLDPKIRELQHAPRMTYKEFAQMKSSNAFVYRIAIANTGRLPAHNVSVVINVNEHAELPNFEAIIVNPPAPYVMEVKGRKITLTFKNSIGSNEILIVKIPSITCNKIWAGTLWTYDGNERLPEFVIQGYVFSDHGRGEFQGYEVDPL